MNQYILKEITVIAEHHLQFSPLLNMKELPELKCKEHAHIWS